MTEEKAKKIAAWIRESYSDGTDFSVHKDYSGRSMYGQTTTAISFDVSLATGCMWIGRAIEHLGNEDSEVELIDQVSSDQLGLGFVVY